jgi:type II secretory pathway component GspD/PulD (secretin)
MNSQTAFSPDLQVPFRQGSFDIGIPDFGSFNANAGINVGLAILSDVEAFFFINAATGDKRSNLMFAPKVTLFNGQQAQVSNTVQRPFVIGLIPTVGFFSVGFQPIIRAIPEGIILNVQAVISADRRYVRLTVFPQFNTITDVFTFSFSGGSSNQQGQTGGGQQGQQGGAGGGFGGGAAGQGGQGGQFGFGGIGGATGQTGQSGQSSQGGQQNQGGQNQQAATTQTVQQPVLESVNVTTTVSVPDGGTVLLGGIKRLREGRNMAGVPILSKLPYINRLFKNTGVGRETESLMLMVTPRIIIQEEEEELLGIPL